MLGHRSFGLEYVCIQLYLMLLNCFLKWLYQFTLPQSDCLIHSFGLALCTYFSESETKFI